MNQSYILPINFEIVNICLKMASCIQIITRIYFYFITYVTNICIQCDVLVVCQFLFFLRKEKENKLKMSDTKNEDESPINEA